MRREVESLRPPIFPNPFPVRHRFWAILTDQRRVWALMRVDRRRQSRTNFGRVGVLVPESRSGLIMGDITISEFPFQPLLRRGDAIAKTPLPPFPEKIFCLAVFPSETGDSGRNQGLDEKSKKREIIDDSRTILGRESGHVPDSRSGRIMGDSHNLLFLL